MTKNKELEKVETPEELNRRYVLPTVSVILPIVLFFASQIIAGIIVWSIPLLRGWTTAQAEAWVGDDVWAQFIFIFIAQSITVAAIWKILKIFKTNFAFIGLKKPELIHIAYALLGFLIYFICYLVVLVLAKLMAPNLDLEQEQQLGFSKDVSGLGLLLVFFSLVILPPLVEEIVMRGFMFTGLRQVMSFWPATAIVSVLFAMAHLGGAANGLLWVAAIDTLVLSIVLCGLRERTGSLWPSIGLHFIKNGIAFFVLFNMARFFR